MNKKTILMFGLTLIILSVPFFFLAHREASKSVPVCLKEGFCFRAEVVQDPAERARGLMFRENLEEGRGMLFIFSKEMAHAFWMKNTLIPLDIIWINSAKEVVFIAEKAQPCLDENCETINPNVKARYVLEINAGAAAERDIRVGDRLNF
jgi:uncharacterized membrane protein (UPF0127 family)